MQKKFLGFKTSWITYCWTVTKVGILLYAFYFFISMDLQEDTGPLRAVNSNVDIFLPFVSNHDRNQIQEKNLSTVVPPALLNSAGLQAAGLISLPSQAIRSRSVFINLNLLGGSGQSARAEFKGSIPNEITLGLFEDVELIAVLERIEQQSNGTYSWIGRLKDDPLSQAIFVVKDGLVVGNIRNVSGIYQVRPTQEEYHAIYEIDESLFPESIDDTISVPPSSPGKDGTGVWAANYSNRTDMTVTDEEPIVDVMVVYTADARVAAGGASAMEALIHLGMAETNQSYAKSGIGFTLRLVHQYEVDYRETGDVEADLEHLTSTSDGIIDDVHTMRDLYAADVVSFWVADSDICGLTWAMETPNDISFQSKSFSTIRQDCAIGNYSFGHEIGHLMGARHDWFIDNKTTTSTSGRSVYDYSHGYVNPDNRWRTIMAYNDRCHPEQCIRLPYWSNPSVNYNGVPTGINSGKIDCQTGVPPTTECDADTRRTLDNQWLTVAQFRNRKATATIHKSVSTNFIDAGQPITYTIAILNMTSAIANNVVITDTVPAYSTLLAGSVSSGATVANIVSGTVPGSIITWNLGDVMPGTESALTFVVLPDSGLAKGTEITNTAYLVSTNMSAPLPSNIVVSKLDGADCGFRDSFESEVLGEYWMASTTNGGTIDPINNPGDANSGSYSIWINRGITGTASANIILRAALQGRSHVTLDFVWKSFRDDGFVAHADDGIFVSDDSGITWAKVYSFTVAQTSYISTTIQLGEPHSVDFSTTAKGTDSDPILNNNIRIKFQTNSAGTPNGFAVDDVSLNCVAPTPVKNDTHEMAQEIVEERGPAQTADLGIAKSATPTTAGPGDRITYTLVYSNIGSDTANNVIIVDSIPITLTDVTYASSPPVTLIEDTRYKWQVPDLAVNGKGVITVTGIVNTDLTHNSRFVNKVTITATNDISTSNNSGQALVEVKIPQPDLILNKIVTPNIVQPGAVVTYTLTIVNNGLGNATGVVISNTLPSGLHPAGSAILYGTDSDTIGTFPILMDGLTIVPGQQVTLTFPVVIDNHVADTIVTNTTFVTYSEIPSPVQSSITLTIGSLPTVTLNLDNRSLSEKNDTATIMVTLSALSPQDVLVTLGLSGTATYDIDYEMTTQIIIPAGHLNGNSMLFSIDDVLVDPGETIVVGIADVANAKVFGVQQVTVTIVDDDKPVISSTATATATPTATPVTTPEITFVPTPGPIFTPTNTNIPTVTPTATLAVTLAVTLAATPTVTRTETPVVMLTTGPQGLEQPGKEDAAEVTKTFPTLPNSVYLPFVSQ